MSEIPLAKCQPRFEKHLGTDCVENAFSDLVGRSHRGDRSLLAVRALILSCRASRHSRVRPAYAVSRAVEMRFFQHVVINVTVFQLR